MNHMKMLESTGLVRYQELPPAALAAQDTSTLAIAQANAPLASPISQLQMWILLIGVLVIGGMASIRLYRN